MLHQPQASDLHARTVQVCNAQLEGVSSRGDWLWPVQFLGISFVVGKEALGHIQAAEGPEQGGMLLLLAAASVIVLSALCGLKLDLSVSPFCVPLICLSSGAHARKGTSLVQRQVAAEKRPRLPARQQAWER